MKANMKSSQTYKNLFLNMIAFGVQFIINFYISPKIVSGVGTAAYGFIGLANDFVSYATIVTSIFNSVASRFIANAFYKKDYDQANKYFNSLIVANIVMAGIFGLAGIVLVPNLESFLSISPELVFDVKLTFTIIFAAYVVSLVTQVFTTSTFVTNRTDIQGVRNIIQYLVRFALIIIFLNIISIKIYWVALASLVATVVVAVMNVSLTKRLTPELKFDLKYAKKTYAFELAASGCWMALTSISNILLRGLDLTIANIFIGDYEMGLLSIARTFPNNISSIISTVAPIFTPVFISLYAVNKIDELVDNVKGSINTVALLLFVPITGFVVFSFDFYALWQTSLTESEVMIVSILSIITVIQAFFNSVTASMAQLSVVVNKLKIPVIVSLICGIVSVVIEISLIEFTSLGLYAIVISTTIVMVIRYVFFNSIYAAYCLGKPYLTFFPTVLKTWLTIPLLLVIMLAFRYLLPVNSWLDLCRDALICGIVGYAIMALLFGRKQVKEITGKLFHRR